MTTRPLHTIARDIRANWPKVYFGAEPYVEALETMYNVSDMYGWEYGDMIVARFLNNATTWRGEAARRIKAELRAMLEAYNKSK